MTIQSICKYHGETKFNKNLKTGKIRCSKCLVNSVTKRRELLKKQALEYKGGKCSICDYNRCVAALDFHHLDPTKKDFALSNKGLTRSWERIKVELDKCILLCSNCHRELHVGYTTL